MKFGSQLSTELRQKHGMRSIKPRVGDPVRIFRGECKALEG